MRRRPAPLLVAFAVFGVVWGTWQAALPDLAGHYGLTPGPLGLLLTAGFAVALPAMLLTGRLVDRVGVRWGIAVPALAMAAGLMGIAAQPPLALLVVGVVLLLCGSGAYDVAVNGAAMGDDRWRQPARLTLLHAAFSGGGAAGALAGGAVLGAGIAVGWVHLGLGLLVLVVAAMAATAESAPAAGRANVPRAVALAMLPLAVLAALAFVIEGALETWSAIYLRDELGAAAFVGALGPGAFHAAMLGGRLVGAGVATRLGPGATLLVAGGMVAAGMAAALLVPFAGPAIGGVAVAALGASFVVPVVVSLAAVRAGAHAGRAASYVLSLGYAGFLIGPSLIGVLAEAAGLRVALAVVPLAAAVVVAASQTRVARAPG